MLAHYLAYLSQIRAEREQKLEKFLGLLRVLTENEKQQFSTDFYEMYPVLVSDENIIDRLEYYKAHAVLPDGGLMICLEEYVKLRLKSGNTDEIG